MSIPKLCGTSVEEKTIILTGTVEHVLKWHSILANQPCIYEVIAAVISIETGTRPKERIMLLRDKQGPILQVVYYDNTHLNINDFSLGQVLRCMGRMSGTNILKAISIRTATPGEIACLQRFCCVCNRVVENMLK